MLSQLQAAADDTRLRILDLVSRGAPTASEVIGSLGMSQPRVAHHLKILVTAGLVDSRRDGRFMRYTLATSGFESMLVRLILQRSGGDGRVEPRATETGPSNAFAQRKALPVAEPEPELPETAEEPEGPASNQIEDFLL
jgi:DNA-binding transcriptional ArsR family regulator